eukprot:320186-Alexandrium_andersonii.AAC.1
MDCGPNRTMGAKRNPATKPTSPATGVQPHSLPTLGKASIIQYASLVFLETQGQRVVGFRSERCPLRMVVYDRMTPLPPPLGHGPQTVLSNRALEQWEDMQLCACQEEVYLLTEWHVP